VEALVEVATEASVQEQQVVDPAVALKAAVAPEKEAVAQAWELGQTVVLAEGQKEAGAPAFLQKEQGVLREEQESRLLAWVSGTALARLVTDRMAVRGEVHRTALALVWEAA
jgi:hypothetical protein